MNLIALTFILASSAPVLSDAFLSSHHIPMARLDVTNRLNINTSDIASTVRHIFLQHPSDDDDDLRSTRDIILGIRGGGGEGISTSSSSFMDKTRAFVSKNFFLLGMVVAVAFAKLFPQVRCSIYVSQYMLCVLQVKHSYDLMLYLYILNTYRTRLQNLSAYPQQI